MASSEKFKVLITDRFDVQALALLRGDSNLEVTISEAPRPSADELKETQGLIIRSRTKIDNSLLSEAPQLKAIVTATSGFDHIDFTATEKYPVSVMFTPEANAASACEITWALVMACARRLPEATKAVKNVDWKRESLVGRELSGRTYGVIGLGRIGSRVARIAQAFQMKTIAFDPYKDDDHFLKNQTQRVSLEELLKLADVISVHVPATEETKFMIGRHHLEMMSREVIFVNTSRGSVVSERDLVEALREKWISALGLDVFEREPLPRESELLKYPNAVLSPHIGATTSEAFAAASREAAEKIIAFARSQTVSDPLPPQETWMTAPFSRKPTD